MGTELRTTRLSAPTGSVGDHRLLMGSDGGTALPKKERLPRISRTCPEYRKRSTGSREKTLPSLWHSKGLELRAVLELFFSREQVFSLPVDILPFTLSNDAA